MFVSRQPRLQNKHTPIISRKPMPKQRSKGVQKWRRKKESEFSSNTFPHANQPAWIKQEWWGDWGGDEKVMDPQNTSWQSIIIDNNPLCNANTWRMETQKNLKFRTGTLLAETLPRNRALPDICDNNNVLAISLMTIKVRETYFYVQIIKGVVFHFSGPKSSITSVTGFCPLSNCPEISRDKIFIL